MNSDISDTELWGRLRQGNRLVLNTIYSRHFHSLYQYGIRMVQDEDVVRDCIQNLFVKIWINREKSSVVSALKNYLISSLRYEIINHQNRENKFQKVDIEHHEVFDLKFTVEQDLIRKEEESEKVIQLAKAMNDLTARQKEIIYLRYFEELEYEEIAQIMDLTVRAAYKLSARALEALRIVLKIDKAVLLALLLSMRS